MGKRFQQFACLMALAGATMSPIAAKQREAATWPAVVGANAIIPPGPEPAFNEADYQAYRASGTGSVVADVSAHFVDGSALRCRDSDDVMLYPATPYVLWALRSWIAAIDNKHTAAVSPQDVVHLPAILKISPSSVLAFGHCHDGHVVFHNVPSGKYYLVGTVEWRGSAANGFYSGGYTQSTEMGPDGLHVRTSPNGPYVTPATFGDVYVMTANEPVEVRNGLVHYLPSDAIHPAAHILRS